MEKALKFDEIGICSEIKIDIIRKYASAYAKVLRAQKKLTCAYIDAFAGPGRHIRKGTGESIEGSPLVALSVDPSFDEYYFIDIVSEKMNYLQAEVREKENVRCFVGDANEVLLDSVFPNVKYTEFKRALCVLDPYGLHLDWNVIHAAGTARSIEIFLNFPVADMNRNVFWKNPKGVDQRDIVRMTQYWGDDSWRDVAYTSKQDLFGFLRRTDNETIAQAFRLRLKEVAKFSFVPEPLPMMNNRGATVYYLFFASHNNTGAKILAEIFKKYRARIN